MRDLRIQGPAKVTIMKHKKDEQYREELCIHLTMMRRNGVIQIVEETNFLSPFDLDIILALMSPSFMSSDVHVNGVLYAAEMTNARVIPIIVRAVDLKRDLPRIGGRQVIPRNGKPITEWGNKDRAWCEVAQEIYEVAVGEKS